MTKTLFLTTLLATLPLGMTAEAAQLMAGSSDAAVQVIIHGDVQCPFTKKVINYVPLLQADFGNRIGVQFAEFPLSFHAQAKPAAIAAVCAARQDEGAAFLREAFAHQSTLSHDFYITTAKKIGVRDQRGFEDCLSDAAAADEVDAEYVAGTKLGVNSTPTIFIGTDVTRGAYPYAELKAKVEKALKN